MCAEKQVEGAKAFANAIEALVTLFERAEREGCRAYGLWNERGALSYADVMAAPCTRLVYPGRPAADYLLAACLVNLPRWRIQGSSGLQTC